jgi:hypothetical protein
MNEPRDLIQRLEKNPQLPKGEGKASSRARSPRAIPCVAPGRIMRQLDLSSTLATRAMILMGSLIPDTLWKNPTVLAAMAPVAGALGAGKLRLTGRAANGQRFIANPLSTWTAPSAKAIIDGRKLGAGWASAGAAQAGRFLDTAHWSVRHRACVLRCLRPGDSFCSNKSNRVCCN